MADDARSRPTKNERRQAAREQAQKAREAEKKREKRNRFFLQGGIVVGVIAILAIVGIVIATAVKPAGPGPKNMASGGVTFIKDLKVKETPALAAGAERKAPEVDWNKSPVDVTVYADYMCPACGAFEQTYGTMLENYVGAGDITLRIYPLNFLDNASQGTKYSTRAANMFSCVVQEQPDVAFKLHNLLLSKEEQPQEGTPGLTDAQLLDVAKKAGVKVDDTLKNCVNEGTFKGFIDQNTKQVLENQILGLAKGAQLVANPQTGELQKAGEPQRLKSTPTVIINGKQWVPQRDGELEPYILKLKAELDAKAADATKTP